MSKTIWFISDTHFFHENIIEYCLRPFHDAAEMNEVIIEKWNDVVKPQDHVWHLGDVGLGYGGDDSVLDNLLGRLNGKKRLVVGNHDNLKSPALHKHFERIELWRGFHSEGFTCSHIPLKLSNLRDGSVCVHGHIHTNLEDDPHYINVCVEHTNYTPVPMEEIQRRVKNINNRH